MLINSANALNSNQKTNENGEKNNKILENKKLTNKNDKVMETSELNNSSNSNLTKNLVG